MMKKNLIVTPLEKEAMTHLKGGSAAARSACRGNWSCAGGMKNHILEGYELQKEKSGITERIDTLEP